MTKNKEEDLDIVIYNEEQQWWVNVRDNCKVTIGQFEDSIKLQNAILILAEAKVAFLAD